MDPCTVSTNRATLVRVVPSRSEPNPSRLTMTKKDAICDAALALFAEKGIEATTTREIAERAGAAEGTLYRHFNGKADLAEWLYGQCTDEISETLAGVVEEQMNPEDRLSALVRGIFEFFVTKPASCTYLLSVRDADLAAGDGLSPPMQMFVETLEDGMAEGIFEKESASLVAGWILAMVQRTVVFLKEDVLPMDRNLAVDRTVQAARRLAEAGDE